MTAATLTLADFLLARIAEDEEVARAAIGERVESGAVAKAHVKRWEPARVLAECEAKRRLVRLHRPSPDDDPRFDPYCVGCWEAGGEDGAPSYPCPTARLLALPYISHPDYRSEWTP